MKNLKDFDQNSGSIISSQMSMELLFKDALIIQLIPTKF